MGNLVSMGVAVTFSVILIGAVGVVLEQIFQKLDQIGKTISENRETHESSETGRDRIYGWKLSHLDKMEESWEEKAPIIFTKPQIYSQAEVTF